MVIKSTQKDTKQIVSYCSVIKHPHKQLSTKTLSDFPDFSNPDIEKYLHKSEFTSHSPAQNGRFYPEIGSA